MNDLTIDVQVLMIRSGLSDDDTYYNDTKELTNIMLEEGNDFFLALDDKGKIRRQYLKKLHGHFGAQWIIKMANADKIQIVPYENMRHSNRRIYTKLERAGFTANKGEDLKYVETARNTESKTIVTYEPHFYRNQTILNRLPVKVKPCAECI